MLARMQRGGVGIAGGAIVHHNRELFQITIGRPRVGDRVDPSGLRVREADPGHTKLALRDRNLACGSEQFLQVAHAHDGLVDLA